MVHSDLNGELGFVIAIHGKLKNLSNISLKSNKQSFKRLRLEPNKTQTLPILYKKATTKPMGNITSYQAIFHYETPEDIFDTYF